MSLAEVQCLVSLLTLVSQTARSYTCTACSCTLPEEKTFAPSLVSTSVLHYPVRGNPGVDPTPFTTPG